MKRSLRRTVEVRLTKPADQPTCTCRHDPMPVEKVEEVIQSQVEFLLVTAGKIYFGKKLIDTAAELAVMAGKKYL